MGTLDGGKCDRIYQLFTFANKIRSVPQALKLPHFSYRFRNLTCPAVLLQLFNSCAKPLRLRNLRF